LTTETWGTNAALADIAERINRASSVIVLTHVKPDGDAVGSSLALVRAIAQSRRTSPSGVACPAEAWYTGPVPLWFSSVHRQTKTRSFTADMPTPPIDPDLIVVVDTGSWSQLDRFADWVRPRREKTAVIDHHRQGDPEIGVLRVVDTVAASATEIVAELACLLLKCASPAELDESIAEPLYLGLATDTGWFKHSNVTPRVLRLAADLLEAGVDHERLFLLTESRDRPARLKLMARALCSIDFAHGGTVAIQSLRQKDFDESGAAPQDIGGLVDIPKSVEAVKVSVLLTELKTPDGVLTKVSMRSKGGPDMVDVNLITQKFGGGGHAQAAGARIPLPIEEAKAKLIEALA
jgi:bifunctional oligoribonuclease and PAP phosphatase NrnA